MALSGTFTQVFTNNGAFRLRVEWSATQDISGNYSTVWADLYIDSLQSWASVSDATSSTCAITINGSTKTFYNNSTLSGYGSKKLGSHGVVVYHNADGTKQFTISASHNFDITWNGSYVGTVNVSGSAWLNTIPRATTPTLSNANPVMGSTITINLPRASDSFTHYVYHDFFVGSWTQINAAAAGTSLNWTLPLEEYALRIINAASGGGRIKVDTYNGGTYIGSEIVNFTASVPSSAIPTIGTATVAETVAGLQAQFGGYVQTKSKLALAMSASGVYGSTITAYKITANGTVYPTASATTAELNVGGAQNVVFEATDSRGRVASVTTPITVLPYAAPSITSFTAVRADETGAVDDEGTYAKVDYLATMSPVNGGNIKTLTVRYKKTNEETWSEATVTNASFDNLSGGALIPGFDIDYAYDVAFDLTDYFNTVSKEASPPLPTGFTLINYHPGGRGMAFGKVAGGPGFENGLMTLFTGGIEAVELLTGDGSLAYWQTVKGGYYYATLGSVTGQPRPSGLVQVIRVGTDFSVLWHDLTSQNMYRLYGSATVLSGWTLVSGKPVTFAPTLLNKWVNYNDGFATSGYWKDSDNQVHLRGLIKSGTVADGTVIFTLPQGFRPLQKQIFIVFISGGGYGRVDVNDNGNVVAKIVNATYTSLSGISFLAEN